MIIASLIARDEERSKRHGYAALFSPQRQGSHPSVRRIQGWIEEAWAQGFDEDGRKQLKGIMCGWGVWIGVMDLYAMFSYLGVEWVSQGSVRFR